MGKRKEKIEHVQNKTNLMYLLQNILLIVCKNFKI